MTLERDLQPPLLWARLQNWLRPQVDDDFRIDKIQLMFFNLNTKGAWVLTGGRLYWDEDISDGFKLKCDQDDLFSKRENVGECVLYDFPKKNDSFLWKNIDEFLKTIRSDL